MEQTAVCGKYLRKRDKGNSTHYLAKILGFYLLLKAEAPQSGLIQNYISQLPELALNFSISPRSFFTYVKQLEEMKLVTRDADGNLRIASWHQLGDTFGIKTNKRTQIKFNYETRQKIHWWFAALEVKSNQELQADMVWKKANKNSEIQNLLMEAMISRGFDKSKANNPEYFSGRLFMLYIEDFKTGTEVHDILIHIRSDVNRGCKKIAESWSMSPQLVSYWKKQMNKQRIIDVAKFNVTSEWTRETNECHKNKFCHVIWNDKLKERVWFLCDQITVLMPWKWQEWLELQKAA
jgi:predicted transcriptional regulator